MTALPYNPAVRASRSEPDDSLDFFPTPPWATRALVEQLGEWKFRRSSIWDPACGAGHMVRALKDATGKGRESA